MAPWSEVPSQVLQRLSPAKRKKTDPESRTIKKDCFQVSTDSSKYFNHFNHKTVVSSSNKSYRKLVSTSFKLGSNRPPSPASFAAFAKAFSTSPSSTFFANNIYVGGFLKMVVPPKIIHFNRVFHYKPSILGYHHFRKHPWESKFAIVRADMFPILLRFFLDIFSHPEKMPRIHWLFFSFSQQNRPNQVMILGSNSSYVGKPWLQLHWGKEQQSIFTGTQTIENVAPPPCHPARINRWNCAAPSYVSKKKK